MGKQINLHFSFYTVKFGVPGVFGVLVFQGVPGCFGVFQYSWMFWGVPVFLVKVHAQRTLLGNEQCK